MRAPRPGRFYGFLRVIFRSVLAMTMRWQVQGLEHEPGFGGCILAVCHLHHLDPVVVSTVLRRRVGWMSRIEFFRGGLLHRFLAANGAFPVDRAGYARPALRESLARLKEGEVVGIFPEGEIMAGPDSVLEGGSLRHGTAWLAARSGCPVLPVVILGTERLSEIGPWLPAKRGRLRLAAGPLLHAPPSAAAKAGRARFSAELAAEFRRLATLARQSDAPWK